MDPHKEWRNRYVLDKLLKLQKIMELDALYEKRRNLKERKKEFFNGDENPHYGDHGYQNLLQEISDLDELITETENEDAEETEIS